MCRLERLEAFARTRINESTCKTKMISIIVKGGKIVSYDTNKNKYRDKTIHAEVNAINNMIRQKRNSQGCDIFVFRFLASGDFGIARPCNDCWNAIVRAGIKRVWYSDYGNRMVMEKVY